MKKNGIITNLAAAAVMVGVASCTGTNQTAENSKCNATEAVIENIMTRTSVRQFSEKAVAKDTLDLLLRAGMAAPTALGLCSNYRPTDSRQPRRSASACTPGRGYGGNSSVWRHESNP